ncbi:MAG: diacylglycerol kinase [Rhodocyclaceae bacterium]|jgi:diacylglycerol kinase (ATP)|nr:diacylglycerol kinase [Rhodocyclaceae bacterium]MCO5096866.1 diacylglycerol kinase [Rhodocyclaceae bacterium]
MSGPSPHKSRGGFKRILNATRYSRDGLLAAWRHEAAFRQELLLVAVLLPLGLYLGSSGIERALLVGSLLLILIVELLNSAVETVVDRVSSENHDLSKRAKDLGSAAVMLSLMNAAVVWGLTLWPLIRG